ncbi:MAG: hypothetical protein V3V30_06210 [Parvularculaceae bacterium]
MAKLESAVQELKAALDELNMRVEMNQLNNSEDAETVQLYRKQAAAAGSEAEAVAKDLAGVIGELKTILNK